jgi:hypothetical protein
MCMPLDELRQVLSDRGDRITRFTREGQFLAFPVDRASDYVIRNDRALTAKGAVYIASSEGSELIHDVRGMYWREKIRWSRLE